MTLPSEDRQSVEALAVAYRQITHELGKVIVGQQQVIEQLLVAIFARGHCLLVGVPGLAKTLMIRTLASALSLQFNRIQFTPDLMPADITGTEVIQEDRSTGVREYRFLPGPVFANIVLADEINRTPPKTQAALLEAMQEQQVTVGGRKHVLPEPFFVLATQNPDRARGHVSAAGGPVGPVHAARVGRLSHGRRGTGDREADDGRPHGRGHADAQRRADHAADADHPQGADCRSRGPLRPATGPADAAATSLTRRTSCGSM